PALPMPDAMPRRAATAIEEPPARAELAPYAPDLAALAPRNAPPAAIVAACPPCRSASMPPAIDAPCTTPWMMGGTYMAMMNTTTEMPAMASVVMNWSDVAVGASA